ncbi:hypothetical protein CYMTET_20565 [Cymbomonas tetramitiformis]|uniref:NrS-1 polymerase-like helicase domain-containing protein n=1 Tax=Cymbomonas tetramitiformis TaxID=36881 RepID=A0AAE0G3T2_9CHLO|nr:hypothetical protein CYMTET_20565 [Cymbomonas tetramitiformis]
MVRCWPHPVTKPPHRSSGIKFLRRLLANCEAEKHRAHSTDSHNFVTIADDDDTDQEVTSNCGRHSLHFHSQRQRDGRDSGPYKLTTLETEQGSFKRKRKEASPTLINKLIRFTTDGKVCSASKAPIEYDVHDDGTFTAKCKNSTCWRCPIDLQSFKPHMINFFKTNFIQNNITINVLPHSNKKEVVQSGVDHPIDVEFSDSGKLKQYNSRYACAKYGSSMIILDMANHGSCEEGREQGFSYWHPPAFHTHMAVDQKTVIAKNDTHTKIFWSKIWMDHPKRKTYNGITFEPRVDIVPSGYYNLWKGFSVNPTSLPTPTGERGVEMYLQLVREGACAGDENCYEYLLDWMAHAVQKPWEKPEVAIILFGGQGDGKGVMIREFGKLFGKHYKQVAHSRHFTGHFNALLSDCILLFIDEATNNAKDAHIVKNQITEEWTVLEKKGKDSLDVRSRLHIMMATNVMWPIENDDRRVHIMKVSSRFNRNYDFFNELCKSMNEGGREYLMHVLQNRNIADFIPQKMPEDADSVKTVRLEAKMANMSLIQEWCYMNLCDSAFPFCATEPLETVTVFDTFKDQMKHRGEQKIAEISRIGFTKKMKEIFVGSLSIKTGSSNRRLLEFANLDLCKTDFAKFMKVNPENMEWNGI